MKFLHISDLHIGKTMNGFSMLKEQEYILDQIIEIAEKEQADGILIAGDIYDRAVPTAEAVMVLNRFLTRLLSSEGAGGAFQGEKIRKREVFLISGNHDSPERISFAEKLLGEKGLHIAGILTKEVKKLTREDEYGKVNIYLLPFATAKVMRYVLGREETEADYNSCIKAFTEQLQINTAERNILVTHHFVVGNGETPILSDSENFLSVGGTGQVDASVWKDFDYVALGHIHKAQRVGKETVRYCGSPLKYSFSEAYQEKSATILELQEKGSLSIRSVPLVPLHDMRILKGRLSDLLLEEVVKAGNTEDYLQIILTDTEELFEPMEQLRGVYPNIMQLILEKNIRREEEFQLTSVKTSKRTTGELFEEFYEQVTEQKLSKEQFEMVLQILEEIGEKNETD